MPADEEKVQALNKLYVRLLNIGLVQLRNLAAGNLPVGAWILAEAEHLHAIPSLLNDDNIHRHIDYYVRMRGMYLDWHEQSGLSDSILADEQRLLLRSYAGVWDEMHELLKGTPEWRHRVDDKRE